MNIRFNLEHVEAKTPWVITHPLANQIWLYESFDQSQGPAIFPPLCFFQVSREYFHATWFKTLVLPILSTLERYMYSRESMAFIVIQAMFVSYLAKVSFKRGTTVLNWT